MTDFFQKPCSFPMRKIDINEKKLLRIAVFCIYKELVSQFKAQLFLHLIRLL
jgi:hypothetical protein